MPPPAVEAHFTDQVLLDLATQYRATTPPGIAEGRAVIVTAGPPGAGKSTALTGIGHGFRRIDPDEIKDLLLDKIAADARDRFGHVLDDGSPVDLRELAGWVHRASTTVSDLVRAQSLAVGENFIMEGTLGWVGIPAVYEAELAENGYEHLTIVDVEVPMATAIEQARERWWRERQSGSPLGGRFVSDDVIAAFYPNNPRVSICATRARTLYEAANDLLIPVDLRTLSRSVNGVTRSAVITEGRVTRWSIPGTPSKPVGVPCLRCGRALTNHKAIARGLGDDCVRH